MLIMPLLHHSHFNPRSHEGSDLIHSLALMPLLISIHAPTRGATPMLQLRYSRKPISIHAPTRGATESSSQHTLY